MRHTRDGVAVRVHREFEALDAVVSRLQPEDWRRPVPRPETRDPWTVKDALAHVVYWKADAARALRREPRPPELRGLDVNAINRRVYERWRERSPDEVVAWHREVHAEVMRTIATAPEERFGGREKAPPWPFDLDGHSAEHRTRDVEPALVGDT